MLLIKFLKSMLKKILFVFSFIFIFQLTFSQQKKVVIFLPKKLSVEKTEEKEDIEEKIKKEMEFIKNSKYYECFQKYIAVREDDLNVCETEDCRSSANGMLSMRYLGEGRCRDFVEENEEVFKDPEKVCIAFKNGNCSILSGWEKIFCEGVFNGDADLVLKAISFSPFENSGVDRYDIIEMIAVFWGFKKYSCLACERYLKGEELPLCKQFACEIIFSSDPKEKIEKITRDIAIFNLSRKEKDKNLCELIENSKIKKACLNSYIKTLGEIW